MADKEKDAVTGTETTGHEWDGIKELNTPLPRWWLYTFYVCIVWGIIYSIVYPAWPTLTDYSKGLIGYSSRGELAVDMAVAEAGKAGWKAKFSTASVTDIAADKTLLQYAMAGGRVLYAENCQACHAAGGSGAYGYPALVDDDWLWGGTLSDIVTSIRVGVRSDHDDARVSEMPAFGTDEILTAAEIGQVTDYVLSLTDKAAGSPAGKALYVDNCESCHGDDGRGMMEQGAPNLVDALWLYGGSKDAIAAQIAKPKHGVMPAWASRLSDVSIKQLAVYVHSLGGGK